MDRGDGASSVLRSYDDATLPMSSFKYAVDVGKKHTRTDGWTRVFMQEQYHNICEKPSRIRMGSKNRWRVLADVSRGSPTPVLYHCRGVSDFRVSGRNSSVRVHRRFYKHY
ncbi:PREDICTED: uncharacterized protein LOC108558585 isoform X2 [Nicrophorus vespilloides]|uniref:Uncharacterized protein LOC108558585 isoform X2 n=1 Tax=Nicrophorus vespilloides TaxID=110193 RepID=A0ABM1M8Y7_NICVS|nr:PREDICTED: uncharacterized protein LOC108558585 isoform X2 [Nicrophorus vespilloides]